MGSGEDAAGAASPVAGTGEKQEKQETVMCIECEDVPANVVCEQCEDSYCKLCFMWLHKRGNRAKHTVHAANGHLSVAKDDAFLVEGTTEHFVVKQEEEKKKAAAQSGEGRETQSSTDVVMSEGEEEGRRETAADGKEGGKEAEKAASDLEDEEMSEAEEEMDAAARELLRRAKWLPLRLSGEERTLLRMVEGALDISEYTDNVDVSSDYYGWRVGLHGSKEQIIREQLSEAFSLLSGLYVGANFRQGQRLVGNKSFKDNESFFQHVFELARRYKITSPEKMRGTYGKLMHLLQDANTPGMINFDAVLDIRTVATLVREKNLLPLFSSAADVRLATEAISQGSHSPEELKERTRQKQEARERLLANFTTAEATAEDIELVLDSIGDANSFIVANREPVERMLGYLEHYFDPEVPADARSSLELRYGMGGSKLSHSHRTQYQFVRQTLLLWREIQGNMYRLWLLADADLLSDVRYRLCNTGQGLNRVQPAPAISRAMGEILGKLRRQLGGWIGLSVVHLGDRDVPNALVFIDKYTQVPRILNPIACAIANLEKLVVEDKTVAKLVREVYGGVEKAKVSILRDYFRHGFDGSGSDGGSCIDGRLTSSWNWCSRLEKKSYYYIFLLTGFEGFDGSFRR